MRLNKRLYWLGVATGALLAVSSAAAQISLSSAVDLALRNSTQIRIASADVRKAIAVIAEAKDVYIPNLVGGSGLGPPSIGFPLGQPSLFNVSSQSLVYSYSQRDYIRAATAGLRSAQMTLKDNRDQVTLDCALAYIQLETDTRELAEMDQEKSAAERLVSIERDRLTAGVDSHMDQTNAEITSAQIDIKKLHLEDDASDQRQKLAHLTGLPASSFIPQENSIPSAPDFSSDDSLVDEALSSNAGIKAAAANAESRLESFWGDQKQNYRPQFAFGAQYSRFASFENYSQYYFHFTKNNFGAEVQITLPFFDATRRAKARESAADANHAISEAVQAKHQTTEQVEALRHDLKELRAQLRLNQLQSEYAQEQLEAVQSELKNGTGSPNAAAVTPKDEEMARIQAQQRHQEVLNANLSVMRAQLSLMRVIGTIGDWVNSAAKP